MEAASERLIRDFHDARPGVRPSGFSGKRFSAEGDNLKDETCGIPSIVINEAQLLLAEKRTSLAVMRTGIAVLALPMSVTSFLIVTSKYYDSLHVLHYLIPLGIINFLLLILGAYLIARSILRMRHYDNLIHEIKENNRVIGKFID